MPDWDNPASWRLQTPGGIKYRFLGVSGNVERDNASVVWRVIILTTNLLDFMEEVFPAPKQVGYILIPQYFPLPNFPYLVAKSASFKSLDTGMPIDPFGQDSPPPDPNPYYPAVEIDVQFEPISGSPDEDDPLTFLEISGSTTGEFISSSAPSAKWQTQTSGGEPDPDTGEVPEATDGAQEENTDPTVGPVILVPQTEWNLKWPQIKYEFFRDVLVHRLRYLLGRVNDATVGILFNAPAETLLMTGYSMNQQVTWRRGQSGFEVPPISVEVKFTEKLVIWENVIKGHNDFWRPGKGWERLLIDGTRTAYEAADYGLLFRL